MISDQPIHQVEWIPIEKVHANDYNPNSVATQEQVDRAKASALSVAEKPPKYAKVVCEHCGHVMFIKEGDAVFSVEQS